MRKAEYSWGLVLAVGYPDAGNGIEVTTIMDAQ
jgi:hypothetical protein